MADACCLKCQAPLERPEVGRPPSYCSTGCRRAAEYELRRLQRAIEGLEEYARNLRLQGDPDRQGPKVRQEIDQAEKRLRLLLAGFPEDERVSPP